jgi:hypothetical protein
MITFEEAFFIHYFFEYIVRSADCRKICPITSYLLKRQSGVIPHIFNLQSSIVNIKFRLARVGIFDNFDVNSGKMDTELGTNFQI